MRMTIHHWDLPPRDSSSGDDFDLVPAITTLLLGWLLLGWPWLSGAVTIPLHDKAYVLADMQFTARSIWNGEWPLWNPYILSGHPTVADPNAVIYSPPLLLAALISGMPSSHTVDMTIFAALLACGIGIIMLARNMGWHWSGATTAALATVFGASMAWKLASLHDVLTLAYLPFALLFLHRAQRDGSLCSGAAAGLLAGLILIAQSLLAIAEILFIAGYTAHLNTSLINPDTRRAFLATVCAAIAAMLLVAALPLTISLLGATYLTSTPPASPGTLIHTWQPLHLTTLWLPDSKNAGPANLYMGTLTITLLIAGTIRGVLWQAGVRPFTIGVILLIIYLSVAAAAPDLTLNQNATSATFLLGALAAWLAGHVLNLFITSSLPPAQPWQRAVELSLITTGLLVAVILLFVRQPTLSTASPVITGAAWFIGAACTLWYSRWITILRPMIAAVVPIAFLAADLAANNRTTPTNAISAGYGIPRTGEPDTGLMASLERLIAARTTGNERPRAAIAGFTPPTVNPGPVHGIETITGPTPHALTWYSAATGQPEYTAQPVKPFSAPMFPSFNTELASHLGLRFVVTHQPIEQIDRKASATTLQLVERTHSGYIYENQNAHPRIIVTGAARQTDFTRIIRDGQWPAFFPSRTVLLETPATRPERPSGHAEILAYNNTFIDIMVRSPEGGWLVINDIWHPWWYATIDSAPTPLLRANVLFRAVEIPAGQHRVTLTFRPIAGALRALLSTANH